LQWDGKITGVVQEADGRPIANAVVDYFINPDLAKLAATPTAVVREYSMPTSVGGAVTDENGRFAIRALPPGKFTLRGSRSAAPRSHPSIRRATCTRSPSAATSASCCRGWAR